MAESVAKKKNRTRLVSPFMLRLPFAPRMEKRRGGRPCELRRFGRATLSAPCEILQYPLTIAKRFLGYALPENATGRGMKPISRVSPASDSARRVRGDAQGVRYSARAASSAAGRSAAPSPSGAASRGEFRGQSSGSSGEFRGEFRGHQGSSGDTIRGEFRRAVPGTPYVTHSSNCVWCPRNSPLRSRCQEIRFEPLAAEHVRAILAGRAGLDEADVAAAVRLADGSVNRALQLIESGCLEIRRKILARILALPKEDVFEIADEVLEWAKAAGKPLEPQRERLRAFLYMLESTLSRPHGPRGLR